MEPSRNLLRLFAGKQRARLVPTLLVSCAVTLLVAVPLTMRVSRSEGLAETSETDPAPGGPQILVRSGDDEPVGLDGRLISGSVLISVREEAARGVAFNLYRSGESDPIFESVDLEGPVFDLVSESGQADPFDTRSVPDGVYEMFVAANTDGEDLRTAVSFRIGNGKPDE